MEENDNSLDAHIGERLRKRRTLLRVSQEKLGEQIGVSFQQVQKYEKGVNRISAGQLFHIATFLKVDVAYFYEGFDDADRASGFAEASSPALDDASEGHAMLRALARIRDPKVRSRLVALVEALADSAQPAASSKATRARSE